MKVKAIILAGGEGKRIGGDKPLKILNGKPLIYWATKPFIDLKLDIAISVRDKKQKAKIERMLRDLDLPSKKIEFFEDPDDLEIRGPLAGIFQAMRLMPRDFLLVVSAVDQPLINPVLISELVKIGNLLVSFAVVCEYKGTLEPLPGLYPCSLFPELKHFAEFYPKHSLMGFLSYLSSKKLLGTIKNWNKLGLNSTNFANINTLEDLTRLESWLSQKEL